MTSVEAQQKIAALRLEVAHHDELYHRRAQPEIGDIDYDKLKRELISSPLFRSSPRLNRLPSKWGMIGRKASRPISIVRRC